MLSTQEEPAQSSPPAKGPPPITAAQWALLGILAAVQVSHIVDFIIMMPLGPRYQRDLNLSIHEFGLLVETYGYAAAVSGLLAAFLVDRFDRKRALLVLYAGFTLGTLACGLAPNYALLLVARGVAGACGGVLGAVVLSTVGDVFPEERRGLAMGVVMSSFSLAMIVGIPAGLLASDLGGTGTPFLLLAGLSVMCWAGAAVLLPPLHHHLANRFDLARTPWKVLLVPGHLWAYLLMMLLVFGSFTLIPYLPTYLIRNTGMSLHDLPWMYLCGGAATAITTSLFGRLADRFGKLYMFRVLQLLALVPIVLMTNLGPNPVAVTLLVTTLYMVLVSGRMVPAMALVTASARPAYRGSFMSINMAVQQIAMGLATGAASLFLHQAHKDAPVEGYPLVGLLACATSLAGIYLAGKLRPAAEPALVPEDQEGQISTYENVGPLGPLGPLAVANGVSERPIVPEPEAAGGA